MRQILTYDEFVKGKNTRRNNMEIITHDLGSIKLNDTVVAGDPCYDIKGMVTIQNVLPGRYWAYARTNCWVSRLIVIHENFIDNVSIGAESLSALDHYLRITKRLSCHQDIIGVDSGQAGVYDYKYFLQHMKQRNYNDVTSWYRRICDMTHTKDGHSCTMDARCAVSQSGCGDGGYEIHIYRQKDTNKAVAFVIDYDVEQDSDEEDYNDNDEY